MVLMLLVMQHKFILEQGCSWGPMGPSTVIQDILNEVEPDTILYRLRQELGQQLGKFTE